MIKFFRAIKTAFQYIFRNFGLSFASIIVVTLSFFIVSVVGIAFYLSIKLVKYIDSRPALTIFLRGDLEEKSRADFQKFVLDTGLAKNVVVRDINFSKEEFSKTYPNLEGTINESNKVNLPILSFVYSDSQDNLKKIIEILGKDKNFMENTVDLKNLDKINWYIFNQDQADVIRDASNLLRTSGIAITIFLFVISSILIFITIKLTISYHKKELEIMDLVGADGWFVKLPFIIDGMLYGVIGSLLSTGIIYLFKNFVIAGSSKLVPKLSLFLSEIQLPPLTPIFMIKIVAAISMIGLVVGAVSSFFAIMRYVRR